MLDSNTDSSCKSMLLTPATWDALIGQNFIRELTCIEMIMMRLTKNNNRILDY
jgi:hypothetical protein